MLVKLQWGVELWGEATGTEAYDLHLLLLLLTSVLLGGGEGRFIWEGRGSNQRTGNKRNIKTKLNNRQKVNHNIQDKQEV